MLVASFAARWLWTIQTASAHNSLGISAQAEEQNMALTILSGPIGQFDPTTRDQASLARKIALACFGAGGFGLAGEQARQTARAELLGRPDFVVRAKTTDNTAASAVMDLTALGVTFTANLWRKLTFKSTARSDNDIYTQVWDQYVLGGTTPALVGSPILRGASGVIAGTVVQYGRCHVQATYSTDTATAVAANSSAGSSLGNNSTNTITLTHPIARSSPKYIAGINNCPATATASGARHVAGISANSTTFSLFVTDLATPSAASPAPTALDVDFFIVPPPSVQLAMATNNVTITAGHDATDDLIHDIEVFVGKLEDVGFSPT